jgi:hypothetical protein
VWSCQKVGGIRQGSPDAVGGVLSRSRLIGPAVVARA